MSLSLAAPPQSNAPRAIALAALTLALGYLVVLAAALVAGHWLIDAQGRAIASDFVNVWAAGKLALEGHAAQTYDWTAHKAMEVRAVGHAFDNYYGWHYAPVFLLVAAPLALLPFLPAAIVWLAVTLPAYLVTMRAIAGERTGVLLALGFPAALWNVVAGQNGFLTAALIGGTLTLIERRPALAGVCLGLLSYKPHFGLLFPVALIAGRHWRTLASAAAVAGMLALSSWIAFGTESWSAFFQAMPATNEAVLEQGRAEFARLQTVFGFLRSQGGGLALAWTVQVIIAAALAVAVALLWRSRADVSLKAAGLATAALLATPYLYIYDLVVLAVPLAFFLRYAFARGLLAVEAACLAALCALLLVYPYFKTQVGLAATLIAAILITGRVVTDRFSSPAALSAR